LRERARHLPVTYEPAPNRALLADGIEPDTLGLFVGEELAESGQTLAPMPAQIILFLDNIWDQAEGAPDIYREEVRTTYLHELGHYLGLDEIDLDDRGLA
jgi:predicted Zn-dependent protease with MMP-like domain